MNSNLNSPFSEKSPLNIYRVKYLPCQEKIIDIIDMPINIEHLLEEMQKAFPNRKYYSKTIEIDTKGNKLIIRINYADIK